MRRPQWDGTAVPRRRWTRCGGRACALAALVLGATLALTAPAGAADGHCRFFPWRCDTTTTAPATDPTTAPATTQPPPTLPPTTRSTTPPITAPPATLPQRPPRPTVTTRPATTTRPSGTGGRVGSPSAQGFGPGTATTSKSGRQSTGKPSTTGGTATAGPVGVIAPDATVPAADPASPPASDPLVRVAGRSVNRKQLPVQLVDTSAGGDDSGRLLVLGGVSLLLLGGALGIGLRRNRSRPEA